MLCYCKIVEIELCNRRRVSSLINLHKIMLLIYTKIIIDATLRDRRRTLLTGMCEKKKIINSREISYITVERRNSRNVRIVLFIFVSIYLLSNFTNNIQVVKIFFKNACTHKQQNNLFQKYVNNI